MLLVLLCLCRWLGSDGTHSPLQVQVAPPILRAVWEPPRLDAQKLGVCSEASGGRSVEGSDRRGQGPKMEASQETEAKDVT